MAVLTALWLQHCRQLIVCRASQEGIVLAAGAWDLGPDSSGGSGGEDGHVADRDHRTAPHRTFTWCQELTSSAQGRSPVRALWPGPQLATDNGSPEASLVVEHDDGTLVVFTVSSGGAVREISKVKLAMAEKNILNIAHVLLCDHETLVLTAQVGRDQSSSYSVFIVDLATGQAQPCDGQNDFLAEADCGTCSSFACYARCLRSGQVSVLTTKETSPSQAETLLWKSKFSLPADCARYALLGCACTCVESQSNSIGRHILCLVSDSGRAQVVMSDSPGIALREKIAAGFTGMLESACPEIALLHCDKSATFSSDARLQATTSLRFEVLRGPNEEAYECCFTWDPASGLTRLPRKIPHQQGGLASTAQRMVLESLNAQVTQAKEAFASRRAFLQQKEKLVASLELDIEGTCASDRATESQFSPETDLEPLFDDRVCPTSTLTADSRDCEIAGDAAISPEQVHVTRVACSRHMLRVDAIVQGTKDVCIFALVDGANVVHAQCYRGSWDGSPDAQHFLVSIILETDQVAPMQGCQIELYCWDPSLPRHVFLSRTLEAPFQELNLRRWREEMEDLALFSDYWKVGVSVAEDADASASTLADIMEMHYDGEINSKDCGTVRWKSYQDRGLEIAASHAIDFAQAMERLRAGLNRQTKLFIVPGQTKSAWLQAMRAFCEAAQQEIQTLSNNARTSPALAINLQLQTDHTAGYLANGITLFGLREQG